jgi:hypothetical protein
MKNEKTNSPPIPKIKQHRINPNSRDLTPAQAVIYYFAERLCLLLTLAYHKMISWFRAIENVEKPYEPTIILGILWASQLKSIYSKRFD